MYYGRRKGVSCTAKCETRRRISAVAEYASSTQFRRTSNLGGKSEEIQTIFVAAKCGDGVALNHHVMRIRNASMGGSAAVICIMNGIGDAFLALPVIRYFRGQVGDVSVFVLTTPETKQTVYSELKGQVFTIDCSNSDIAESSVQQVRELAFALRKFNRIEWLSLNSYSPSLPQEKFAIEVLRPSTITRLAEFIFHPVTQQLAQEPMREVYFRPLGNIPRIDSICRTPAISLEHYDFARLFLAKNVGYG